MTPPPAVRYARPRMRGVSIAAAILVFATGIHFFSIPVADNDLWGHVFFGLEMLREGTLPAVNGYAYTAPDHPWINHEIVAELLFATTWERLGSTGLLYLKILIGLAVLGILSRSARRRTREPFAWAAALVLGASMMSFGFLVRPQLLTFLFLAIEWAILQRRAFLGSSGPLWLLPPLLALWNLSHGGVLAGLGILGVFAFWFPLATRHVAAMPRLAIVAALSALALFVNPYGAALPVFLAEDVLLSRPITEWQPISLAGFGNLHFKATVLVLAGGAILRRFRPWWETPILFAAAFVAFRHERHLPLFAILVVPHLAETFGLAIEHARRRFRLVSLSTGARAALLAGIFAIAGWQLWSFSRLYAELGHRVYVPPSLYPIEAVRFLEESGAGGNLAVPFDWGEYAIWHLYPRFRVSVDGRYTTAYPPSVLDDAWRYMEGSPGWDAHLAEADVALVDPRHGTDERLRQRDDWRLVHADPVALVFARTGNGIEPRALPPPDPHRLFFP